MKVDGIFLNGWHWPLQFTSKPDIDINLFAKDVAYMDYILHVNFIFNIYFYMDYILHVNFILNIFLLKRIELHLQL